MKKILIYLWVMMLVTACTDYLDLKPKNVVTPKTVKDVEMILAKYLNEIKTSTYSEFCPFNPIGSYFSNEPFRYMDGDTEFSGLLFQLMDQSEQFEWRQVGLHTEIWNALYRSIGTLNLCLYELDNVSGDEVEKKQLRAELLMHRAFLWTRLLEYYAPYRANTYAKDISDYGIVIFKGPKDLEEHRFYPARLSQKESFRAILEDLEAIDALKVDPGVWNLLYNKRSLHGLWAEVYQWRAESVAKEEGDWAKVREHAEACIAGQALEEGEQELASVFAPVADCPFSAFKLVAPGKYTYHANLFDMFYGGKINEGLIRLYDDADIRKELYFRTVLDLGTMSEKYVLSKFDEADEREKVVMNLWRVAEMKLMIAESYCREGNTDEAARQLEAFRRTRIPGYGHITGTNILEEIIGERRKEFVYEPNVRWLDMKRIGIRLERTYPPGKTATLEKDDFRYTFQIPVDDEIAVNPNCFQNPGWEIVKFD